MNMINFPPGAREKILWASFYTAIAISGVFVLVTPPITIDAPILTTLWGIMLSTAIIPAIAVIPGRFKIEYTTLPLIIAGVGVYAAKVWYLTHSDPWQGAKAALITALAIGLTLRWAERRTLVLEDKMRQRTAPGHMTG